MKPPSHPQPGPAQQGKEVSKAMAPKGNLNQNLLPRFQGGEVKYGIYRFFFFVFYYPHPLLSSFFIIMLYYLHLLSFLSLLFIIPSFTILILYHPYPLLSLSFIIPILYYPYSLTSSSFIIRIFYHPYPLSSSSFIILNRNRIWDLLSKHFLKNLGSKPYHVHQAKFAN